MNEKCHICGKDTDWYCNDCHKPVCEDCCVVHTIHNQIDYPLCKECYADSERERLEESHRELLEREKADGRNAKARIRYWKPENIEKRRKKHEKELRRECELEIERATHVVDTLERILKPFRG
jgi:NAD-dependent SIR2 family protein deacetylase